jgi:hypothetical protein
MMSRLEPTDEFIRRIVPIEKEIVADELYHGPETIVLLAQTPPDEDEFEKIKQQIKQVRSLELRQRNEQFLHPLTENQMRLIEEDFLQDRVEPLNLFRTIHVRELSKDQAKHSVIGTG